MKRRRTTNLLLIRLRRQIERNRTKINTKLFLSFYGRISIKMIGIDPNRPMIPFIVLSTLRLRECFFYKAFEDEGDKQPSAHTIVNQKEGNSLKVRLKCTISKITLQISQNRLLSLLHMYKISMIQNVKFMAYLLDKSSSFMRIVQIACNA